MWYCAVSHTTKTLKNVYRKPLKNVMIPSLKELCYVSQKGIVHMLGHHHLYNRYTITEYNTIQLWHGCSTIANHRAITYPKHSAVECGYNAVQYNIILLAVWPWVKQNMNHRINSYNELRGVYYEDLGQNGLRYNSTALQFSEPHGSMLVRGL